MEINIMTEGEFWDKFNERHNPRYYYAKKKTKEEKNQPDDESSRDSISQVQSGLD